MRPGDVDLKESLAKGVGATASRYRSRAARTAHELYVQGAFGETTRTPAEQKLMQKHRSAIDAGKFDPNAVRTDLKAGRLTERDAKLLISESQSPQLRDFKRLPLEKALEVWEVANDDERKQLRPALQNKAKSLQNRVPAERVKLQQQQLRGALNEATAPQPAIPQFFKKLVSQTRTTATAAKP